MVQSTEMLIIACECGQKMKVPSEAAGKMVSCVKCGEKIKIVAEPEPAATPTEPAPLPKGAQTIQIQIRTQPRTEDVASEPDEASILHLMKRGGLIDDVAIKEARLVQQDLPRSDWETLIDIGRVSSSDFNVLLSKQPGITTIDLKNYSIPGEVLDFVSSELIHKGRLFPVDKLGKLLTLAMACPLDMEVVNEVAEVTGLKVKVMLCSLDDLRDSIRTYYPDRREQIAYDDTFAKELAKEFNESIEKNPAACKLFDMEPLPPVTQSVEKLQHALQDSVCPLSEITPLAALDPATAVFLLSPANSSAYGLPKRVDNLEMAVAVLGRKGLTQILDTETVDDYAGDSGTFDSEAFWNRARFCARAAKAIATTLESQRMQTICTAALLHEIGRLGMHQVLPHSYAAITAGIARNKLIATEERVFKITHPEAGYMLARKANLPTGLTEAIRHHRNPDDAKKSKEVVSIVALAALMADAQESDASLNLKDHPNLLENLNLTDTKATRIYTEACQTPAE